MVFINCLPGHSAPTALPAWKGHHRMPNRSLATLLAALLLTLALACAGTASAAIPAGNTGWSWANPLPQGNTLDSVAVSGGRAWAGGATGTLLHSDDLGATWTATRTGILDDIRTIEAISPSSVVFAGRCALRRTDDGGNTVKRLAWGASDDTCDAQIQALSFPLPLIGYMLLTNGDVYATGDGGDSWNKRGVAPGSTAVGGADSVRDISFSSASTGVLSAGNRILQTVDAGVNWTPVAAPAGNGQFNFEFLNATIGFAAGNKSDFLKTTDSGATWTVVPTAFPGPQIFDVTGISCASELVCLVTTNPNVGYVRTVDGGASWSGSSSALPNAAKFIDARNAVAVGARGAVSISSDAGASFTPATSSASGSFTGIRADSSKSAFLYGAEGSIARSTNGGQSWNTLVLPFESKILDVTSTSRSRIFALTSGGIQRSSNGGIKWKRIRIRSSVKPKAIFAWKPSRVLIVGSKGVRVSTRNGSASKPVKGRVSKFSLTSVDGARSSVFVYGKRSIAATRNKGRTWSIVKRPRGSGSILKLDMVDPKNGFLLDSKAELFSTKTGGKKWTRVSTTGANVASSIAFGDRKHGYITDNTGRVLATADGGKTWVRQYPFYDALGKSVSLIAAPARRAALTLVTGTNRVFGTTTGGRIGSSSKLTIAPSAKRARKGSVVRVTGRLSPATGTERVAVLARVVNAKGGTRWVSQERTVSATGTFTTSWRVSASTEFIARWSGDASHDGDAAPLRIVKLRK